jgi:toxin ParE1/3/4
VRVRFTPSGRAQFLAAVTYIRADNPDAARRFRHRAEQILRRLERFPNSGRKVPEFPDLPYREVIVKPYRFFYRPLDGTAWIIAVWHGAQRPERPR